MAALRFRHINKAFSGGVRTLDDFDLMIGDGELMVLVGPSGCGKSTALRLLAGLEQPDAGELFIGEERVNDVAPQERNIAMVFQNYALYPHMSVRRNLEFPLRMQGLPAVEITRRSEQTARLLQLDDLLERLPAQLSGGQRQRVAMGRAIVREPCAFLMDEPLSNLDAKLRVEIRSEIASLQRRLGITTLYVTHDQVEAMTLGDRVAVLHAGRLQQVDTPQALYKRPANTFVARFIGSPGMNILPGRLRRTDSGMACELAGHWLDIPTDGCANHAALANHLDRPLHIGLRPEALRLGGKDLHLPLRSVESLGHEQLLYCDAGGAEVVVRLREQRVFSSGEELPLAVDPRQIYLFDAEGKAIG